MGYFLANCNCGRAGTRHRARPARRRPRRRGAAADAAPTTTATAWTSRLGSDQWSLPEVLADPQHIVQVLINLLTNASKYSEAETRIGISCTAEHDQVRIAVTDQGIGIPEDQQRHVFERFYRVPSNTMTSVVGSGLGLTIVKSLVEMHRGRVGVSSAPGAGSVFCFTLPQVSMAHAS